MSNWLRLFFSFGWLLPPYMALLSSCAVKSNVHSDCLAGCRRLNVWTFLQTVSRPTHLYCVPSKQSSLCV